LLGVKAWRNKDDKIENFVDKYPEYNWNMDLSFGSNFKVGINKEGYVWLSIFDTKLGNITPADITYGKEGGLISLKPVHSLQELVYELNNLHNWGTFGINEIQNQKNMKMI